MDHQTLAKAHAKAIVHAVEQLAPHVSGDDAAAGSSSTSQLNAGTKAIIGSVPSNSKPFIIIVMAVSAGGKSTVGPLLTHVLNSKFSSLAAHSSSSSTSGSNGEPSQAPSTEVEFLDADSFHSEANKKKMSQGTGLTDEDRAEWLEKCSLELDAHIAKGHSVVFACSSLKKSYRRLLFAKAKSLKEATEQCEQGAADMQVDSGSASNNTDDSSASRRPNTEQYLVFLRGSFALLNERIKQRAGHFAGANLLQSQFDTLQPPSVEECAAMNVKFYTVDLDANRDFRVETDIIADWIVSERKL